MLKDIDFNKPEEVAIAVLPMMEDNGDEVWKAFVINMREEPLEQVFVRSEGYGEKDGERVKTSTLRHFFKQIDGQTYEMLEILPDNLTSLNNQFWISFWREGKLYDKKYVFVTESLVKENLITVPIIDMQGVMIK